jgi:hypothetical protein
MGEVIEITAGADRAPAVTDEQVLREALVAMRRAANLESLPLSARAALDATAQAVELRLPR